MSARQFWTAEKAAEVTGNRLQRDTDLTSQLAECEHKRLSADAELARQL